MAKKTPSVSGLLRRTEQPEQAQTPAPTSDKTTTVSVGLKESEIRELGTIAQELGVTRNNLMGYALRRFIRDYRAGKIKPDQDTTIVKRQLKL